METEWKAKTGRVSLLTRSAATVRLAYSVSRSVKKLEHELASQPDLDKEIVEKRWNQLHRKNAKLVHQHILKYRGFLTKFGQAASTKAGSLPAPWVEELRDLQDELPISNYQEVVRTIRTGLGRPLEELFRDFGQRPIASASVGQAHVAYLRSSGQKVCVKVQHHGVGSLMKTDLVTIEFIAGQMMKLHKGAPDFRDLIREWRRAAKEEVDFQLEAKNALQASKALRRNSVDVVCPEPLQDLCSQRVLTMVFIEGWKITDLDRMPYGADREGLARNLVHAFALLVFEEGLIHGDPHPGNVFVQQVPGGKNAKEVRPVLLDWGIVKRLTVEERLAAAKWIISVLSQDRQLHISSLLDLGFEFDADPDLPEFATFIEGSMSQCAFLFRDSIPSSSQINFLQQMQEHQEKAENQEKEGKEGKDQSKLIGKVPGVVLFFLRGLEMLQNICGMLEVTVPFASIMLENCMPLLGARGSWNPATALPGPPGQTVLEQKVRAKLNDFDNKGLVLGAQVAVWDRRLGTRGEFLCSATCGRIGVCHGLPISDQTAMPLMKLSAGPLLHCLLRAMSQPTAHGKQVSLGTALSEFWPDFSQRGKAASIGDVLQHQAGLAKPFPSDMSIKAFCNETRMEEAIAAAPICHEDEGLCPVWGDVLAAVLKRIVGRKSAQDALSQTLGPMAGEFSYRAPSNCHSALAGRRPQERVTMQSIYEWLEEKVESFDSMAHNTANSRRRWLSETELTVEKPWMTDPMIVNREAMLIGHSCIAGFGLRATAKALCRMFTSDLVPAEMLAKSLEPGRDVKFATVQQWWDSLGAPQRALGGWQLFPFKTKTTEVQGYGFSDGTTGSIVLRLPEVTLAILLSSCSPRTRHIGRSLLDTICSELGFEVGWVSEPPAKLPKRPGETAKSMPKEFKNDGKQTDGARRADDLQQELVKVEAKVAKLSEVLDLLLPGASEAICGVPPRPAPTPQRTMAGFWLSDETEGLESLLEALQVPAMMRSMASAARRTLKIDIEGNEVQISSTTSMLGRQLEETLTRFQVGSSFTGEQAMGGAFTAVASWIEDKEPHQPACLHLVKQFASEGIQLDELFQLQADARLALTTTLSSSQHQFEDRKVELHRQEELEMFCAELGEDLILKKQLALPGTIKALPGGSRITGLGPPGAEGPVQEAPSFTDLRKVQLPTTVFLCVEAIRSTTYFCQEGGSEGIGEKSMPSELLDSLPPEIRTALAERQEAYQAYQTPSPSSAASPLTVLKAPSSGPKPTPSKSSGLKTFFFTSCGALSWAACSAMGQAAQLTTRGSVYLCRAGASNLCALPSLQRPRGEEYKVFVDRTMGQRLGLRVDKEDGDIFVLEVQDGLVQEWNDSNPDSQVRVGDILLEVNGQSGDTRTMMDLCKACQPLEMKLRREALSAEAPEVKVGKAQLEEVQEQEEADGQVETRTTCGGVPPSVEIQEAVSSQGLAKLELPKPVQLDSNAGSTGLRHKRQGTDAPSSSSRFPKTEPKVCGALEDPTVGATFLDPRNRQQQLGIIAFSRLDPDASAMSRLCRAQVLSNAFDLGRGGMALVAPCSRSSSKFRNAEAAYQATSNWPLSGLFQELGAVAAIRKVQRFGSYRDQTRGGFANSWRAMLAALEAKFAPNTAVAAALVKSGDAFLLDTSEALELDTEEMPPDWIGLLLMIVRDKLTKNPSWSLYIQGFCDLQSGKPVDSMKAAPWKAWQEAVQDAIAAIQKSSSAQLASLDPV